jgi:hypothetical protein
MNDPVGDGIALMAAKWTEAEKENAALRTALATARAEAIEEGAAVADRYRHAVLAVDWERGAYECGKVDAAKAIADAIRSLLDTQKGGRE